MGDGTKVRFWKDIWLGDEPLSNISLRRALTENKCSRWLNLVNRLMQVQLYDQPDVFVWKLTNSGTFSVKSMCLDYMNDNTKFLRKYIWKRKVPLNTQH